MIPRAVPVHYIRANEVNRQPKCWVYLDTEARIEINGLVQTQRWRLAVTCHDHRRGAYDDWRDPEWAVHDTPGALWEWIDKRARVGERLVIVAHNVAYDMRISAMFDHLPRLGWTLDRIRLDAEQAQARWRNGRRTILLIDSISWFPVGLEKLGEDLGIIKPELPDQLDDDATWVHRCTEDVNILRTAWRRLLDWLHDDDIGNWQPTGAGQAWSAWRHRFMDHRVLVDPDPDRRLLERRAAWAGRAEAWRHGKQSGGPFTEWDRERAYLTIMRDCQVPVRFLARPPDFDRESIEHFATVGCVLATVEVETDVPLVPAENPHGVFWPTGRFTTTVWDPELTMLFAADCKVRVLDAFVYRRRPALSQFAEWLWPMLEPEFAERDPVVYRVAKLWSQALIGRFGVRYSEWEPYGETPQPCVGLQDVRDLRDDSRWRMLSIGDRILREGARTEGENAVPSVMGWIMSETRRRLWDCIAAAGPANVLHCDTDGLLVNPSGNERLEQAGIAGLRVKGSYDRAEIFGPRQLHLDGLLSAPGVPRRARRVGADTWSAERWQGLSSSLRAGTADTVRVQRAMIRLVGTDHRRRHLRGGRTAPFEINEVA